MEYVSEFDCCFNPSLVHCLYKVMNNGHNAVGGAVGVPQWLEIVELTSTHSLGSGTELFERCWTLFYSGSAHSDRQQAGVGLLIAAQLSHHVLEFSPVNERATSLDRSGIGLSLLAAKIVGQST